MRIKGAKQVHYDSGPNMTPLVDVVMVILIFLMLAGSFASAEHYLVSTAPITKNGAGNVKSLVPNDETLNILVDSPPGASDRFTARVGDVTTGDPAKLQAALARKRAGFQANGTGVDKIQVYIDPGKNVEYKFLIEVYQAAMQADFTKISFKQAH